MHENTTEQNVTPTITVLIVDDHLLVAETLVAALTDRQEFDIDVVRDVGEALQMVQQSGRYDVILLDYDVPGMDSLKGMKRLIEANAGGVALFSGVVSFTTVERAMAQGACGFIPKTLSLTVLSHAVRIIAAKETYLPAEWLQWATKDEKSDFDLKPREVKVLTLLCEGLQNKEIGHELNMTEVVVKMDVKNICRKLGVRNRTQAVIAAHKRGIFET